MLLLSVFRILAEFWRNFQPITLAGGLPPPQTPLGRWGLRPQTPDGENLAVRKMAVWPPIWPQKYDIYWKKRLITTNMQTRKYCCKLAHLLQGILANLHGKLENLQRCAVHWRCKLAHVLQKFKGKIRRR